MDKNEIKKVLSSPEAIVTGLGSILVESGLTILATKVMNRLFPATNIFGGVGNLIVGYMAAVVAKGYVMDDPKLSRCLEATKEMCNILDETFGSEEEEEEE